jgi:hypothetical protein
VMLGAEAFDQLGEPHELVAIVAKRYRERRHGGVFTRTSV